ncbi:MAG: DNA polymerase III subunit beta [Armatimonadetes bacterium]|nr:DNA polymerase III subunit beta [Armatimonadota bacterium]
MKITCSRKDLFEGVQTAARAVSARSSLPILGHLLVRTQDDRIRLAATDLEIGVECSVPASVEESGSLTAPARILSDVLSTLPDSDVLLSVDSSNKVSLKCGTSDYQILGLPPEEFPMLPEVKDDVSFKIEKPALKSDIEKTIFAVSQDESRASLTGVLLMLEGDRLKMVSTDTHRLCLVDCSVIESKGETTAIVPGRAMAELHRIIQDEDGMVAVNISQNQILFEMEDAVLVSRLIEGQFPNFEKVIPQEYSKKIIVPAEQLMQSVRRAAIVAREDANRVILRTADEKLTVTAESSTVGSAYEEVDIVREGEDVEMAFSAKYLVDFLSVIEHEAIEMQLTSNLSPALLKPQESEDYSYVLMPMQIR